MKIVHVVGGAKTTTVGIERHVKYLAAAQRRRGHEVTILMDAPDTGGETSADQAVPVIVAPELKPAGGLLLRSDGEVTRVLADRVKALSPDVLHCHSLSVAMPAIAAGNQLGVPCLFDCEKVNSRAAAEGLGLRFTTVCISKEGFESISRSGADDVHFVPLGTPALAADSHSRAMAGNLIFAGSLIMRKGVDVALLAMAELRRRLGADCPALDVYGDGPQAGFFHEIADLLDLGGRVIFHGPSNGILERCPGNDILVLPSRLEVRPQVVLEAMSRGMAVIATGVGDVAELIPDERYGRVVAPESVTGLAAAVESMLAQIAGGGFDPRLSVERHRTLYSDDKMAEAADRVYEHVLQRAS